MTQKTGKRRPAREHDKLIFAALRESGRPVSAYELIDRLRDRALLAPQTVYRSLDRLIASGTAHRVESLNAFVACRQPSENHQCAAVFAICDECGTVTEFAEPDAVEALGAWAERTKYTIQAMTLELRGRCAACSAKAS